MEINITYRPFSGTISAWNMSDDTMSDSDRENIKRAYQDGNDDGWFVNMDTFDGKFHSITVLDSNGKGQGWNLFLSEQLDDYTISVIYDQIAKWDAMTPRDDIKNLVLTHHRTTVSV